MGVDVQGRCRARVSQGFSNLGWCPPLLKGDGGERVAQVVNVHLLGEAGVAYDRAEMVPEQVGGIQWTAPPVGEHEPFCCPLRTSVFPLGLNLCPGIERVGD